jgi:ribose 5-phosphate isomerase A
VIIVDESKVVERLGVGCPVPVEVIPEGLVLAQDGLRSLGAKEIVVRTGSGKHGPVITERGNIILDVAFSEIDKDTESRIKVISGVVDSGLFSGYVTEVVVASAEKGVYSY